MEFTRAGRNSTATTAAGTSGTSGTNEVGWDEHKIVATIPKPAGAKHLHSAAFSPDGTWLAIATDE